MCKPDVIRCTVSMRFKKKFYQRRFESFPKAAALRLMYFGCHLFHECLSVLESKTRRLKHIRFTKFAPLIHWFNVERLV